MKPFLGALGGVPEYELGFPVEQSRMVPDRRASGGTTVVACTCRHRS